MRDCKRNIVSSLTGVALCAASVGLTLSSCESIYDDLDPCGHGVSLRFVYDYNMLYANAFPASVDCLTLYIYDEDGNYVGTRTVTGPELQDEDYRMTLELEEGTYRFVAYGGLACEENTFSLQREPVSGSVNTDIRVEIDHDRVNSEVASQRRLHDLFWGELTLDAKELYNEGTVKMMKNTNNIRIVLQHVDGEPVHADDFEFTVTDDNTLFRHDNDLIPNGDVIYRPWASGDVTIDNDETRDGGVQTTTVAYSEFSVSRIMRKNSPRLVIKSKKDGKEVLDIPLDEYLLLLKSELYDKMGSQEYLDRESSWSMVFFLGGGMHWIDTHIKINNWVVRINNAEM